MNFELVSLIAILLVVFYVYNRIHIFITDREKEKHVIWSVSLLSAIGLAFVIYNLLVWSGLDVDGYELFLSIFLTFIMWSATHQIKNSDKSSMFRAVKLEGNSIAALMGHLEFKKVSDFSSKQIPFYIRFTIYELIGKSEELVFDSSDYSIINRTFGAFDDIQQTFIEGGEFQFKDKLYSTEFVKVDFLSIIDDYHMGHTKIYEGLDIPYNIQIIIKLKACQRGD